MHDFQRESYKRLLEACPPISLPVWGEGGADTLSKAGLLPFLPAARPEDFRFCVMRPQGVFPSLGRPPLQICKGTRMRLVRKGSRQVWEDMRGTAAGEVLAVESLAETALREGEEEIGLNPEAIRKLFDLGTAGFVSATSGQKKAMRLFAAELALSEALPPGRLPPSTEEITWCTPAEFALTGREDHRPLLVQAAQRLCEYLLLT